jgi:hypothetical protein
MELYYGSYVLILFHVSSLQRGLMKWRVCSPAQNYYLSTVVVTFPDDYSGTKV